MCSADYPLDRVYWIGGGSGGGKSTVASLLAAGHGLSCYSTDAAMRAHARQLTADEAPLLHRFLAMDMNERWLDRSPTEMLVTFQWFRGEGFDRIIADLRELASDGPVVAEGFHLLPNLVAPLLSERRRAVWLLPTPEFRLAVFKNRLATGRHFVERTSDPDRALAKLAERDGLFTDRLRAEVQSLGLAAVDVDGSVTAEAMAAEIGRRLGLV